MIAELSDNAAVQEVKRLKDSPETHAVAVRGNRNYSDPSMKLATGTVTFPQELLAQIEESDGWEFTKMQFRTSGDYSGCFTFRIQRVDN